MNNPVYCEDNPQQLLAYARWAKDQVDILRAKLHNAETNLATANASVEEHVEAIRGMRNALRLSRTLDVFYPGRDVLVGPDMLPAKVISVTILAGDILYKVSYWANAMPHQATVHVCDVHDVHQLLPLRPEQ